MEKLNKVFLFLLLFLSKAGLETFIYIVKPAFHYPPFIIRTNQRLFFQPRCPPSYPHLKPSPTPNRLDSPTRNPGSTTSKPPPHQQQRRRRSFLSFFLLHPTPKHNDALCTARIASKQKCQPASQKQDATPGGLKTQTSEPATSARFGMRVRTNCDDNLVCALVAVSSVQSRLSSSVLLLFVCVVVWRKCDATTTFICCCYAGYFGTWLLRSISQVPEVARAATNDDVTTISTTNVIIFSSWFRHMPIVLHQVLWLFEFPDTCWSALNMWP